MRLTINMPGMPGKAVKAPKKQLAAKEQECPVDCAKNLGDKNGAAQTILGFGMPK